MILLVWQETLLDSSSSRWDGGRGSVPNLYWKNYICIHIDIKCYNNWKYFQHCLFCQIWKHKRRIDMSVKGPNNNIASVFIYIVMSQVFAFYFHWKNKNKMMMDSCYQTCIFRFCLNMVCKLWHHNASHLMVSYRRKEEKQPRPRSIAESQSEGFWMQIWKTTMTWDWRTVWPRLLFSTLHLGVCPVRGLILTG